ncbi:MAG: acyl carrier protein [Phycisphaerales bacterium]|nr:acyl carrier protein [Phycisphaerales bacterium]
MRISRDEVVKQVGEVLVDALGVDHEDVTENATLGGDLGAESIDYLDIVFRLEKTFGIKIPKGELFPDDVLNNPDNLGANGRISPRGLERLKECMPHADFSAFDQNPLVSKVPDLFTVKTLIRYVQSKLEKAPVA